MKLPHNHVPGVGLVAASARGGLGERLLRKFGWTDGDGLGVGRQGRATPVETKQKSDNAGIGARAPSFDWSDAWWERAFDGAAKALAPKAAASSSSSSSDSLSDGSADRLTTHRDGMATTATAAEMKLAATLAKDKWGRFGGRDGKMARIAAMEAAAAEEARRKLEGGASSAAPAAAAPAKAKPKRSHDAEAGRPSKKAKKESTKKRTKKNATPPPQPDAPPPYTPPPGWWGAATFVHAGRLEGLDEPRPSTRRAFTEADQEAAATGGVARGDKRGLGAASAKKLGRDWKGKKTTFGDDEEGEAEAQAVPSIKWRKLAAAALTATKKALKLDKLIKKVVAAAVDKHGDGGVSAAGGADAARAAVCGSSKFSVVDGRVSLAK